MAILIVTDDKHSSEKTLKELNRLKGRYKFVNPRELLAEHEPFNKFFDYDIISTIYVDCNIDCASMANTDVMMDIDGAYLRRAQHTTINNTDVEIFTYVSTTLPTRKIVYVSQLPDIGTANKEFLYVVAVGSNKLYYRLDDNNREFECVRCSAYSEDSNANQVIGFINLLKVIGTSYYDHVGVMVDADMARKGTLNPVITRDITFDNKAHNIIISV